MYKRIFLGVSALALTLAQGTGAAQLPNTTQKALAELKLNASMLEGFDAELAVPKAWLDGAAKEKEVVILGTWDDKQFPTMTAAFRERYPFVKLNDHRTATASRGMRWSSHCTKVGWLPTCCPASLMPTWSSTR